MGRPPLSEGKRLMRTTGFRFPPKLRAKIEMAAAENDRSISAEVRSRLECSFIVEAMLHEGMRKKIKEATIEKKER